MLLGEDYTKKTGENAVENELGNYFMEPFPSLEWNPLQRWKVNAQCCPRLAKLAKNYLPVHLSILCASRMSVFYCWAYSVMLKTDTRAYQHVHFSQ